MDSIFGLLQFLPVIIIVALVAFVVANHDRFLSSEPALPIVSQPIMTPHELVFIEKLVEAVTDMGVHVFPQVSMAAFLRIKPGTEKNLAARTRNRFAQKRSDFVLADDAMNALLVIELDDSSHQRDKDAFRDSLVSSAGIQTVRFRNGRKLTVAQIRSEIAPHLAAETRRKL